MDVRPGTARQRLNTEVVNPRLIKPGNRNMRIISIPSLGDPVTRENISVSLASPFRRFPCKRRARRRIPGNMQAVNRPAFLAAGLGVGVGDGPGCAEVSL